MLQEIVNDRVITLEDEERPEQLALTQIIHECGGYGRTWYFRSFLPAARQALKHYALPALRKIYE